MDASYDDIELQVDVPVRVFSSESDSGMLLIYFDYFGSPARLRIPAENHGSPNTNYEVRRRLLRMLAQNLETKSHFYMAAKYVQIASQIEVLLRDIMLDSEPSCIVPLSWSGHYPLDWFLAMGRRRYVLTETVDGEVRAVREGVWPDLQPAIRHIPPLPQALLSLSTRNLNIIPSRCGKDRICGSVDIALRTTNIRADTRQYTAVCVRDIGAYSAWEGTHRVLAFQIQQLGLIESFRQLMGREERQAICVPTIRACLFCEFPRRPVSERLLVGCIFDALPKLIPFCHYNAPLEVVRKCVLKICKTVEWLVAEDIGWGGSVDYPAMQKGQALLDAAVVDTFGRPWLMEGFTDSIDKMASDRLSVQSLRASFNLQGVEELD